MWGNVYCKHNGINFRSHWFGITSSASPPAEDDRRNTMVYDSGVACAKLLEMNIRPREILTFEAFENAIMMLNSVGGSTNGILHLLALANEVNIDLTYDDFERIRKKTPHLADMKPGGNYVMESLDKIGGIPFVLKIIRKRITTWKLYDSDG